MLENGRSLPASICLRSLNQFINEVGLVHLSGRQANCELSYSQLIISHEHHQLLHAEPTLVIASLNRRFHIISIRRHVRSITRGCITCCRESIKPQPQKMGKLPTETITSSHPGIVFAIVGVDNAGPIKIKSGPKCKPIIVKDCVFVAMSVKVVHIEVVSDLTTDAFLSCLRRFIACRGKPKTIKSDHGTNFVGADRELKNLTEFLQERKTQETVGNFCSSQAIHWKFIPEWAPHFGGIWEAAVKSLKTILKKVIGDVPLSLKN